MNFFDPDGEDTWKINQDGVLVSIESDDTQDCFQIINSNGDVLCSLSFKPNTFVCNSNLDNPISFATSQTDAAINTFQFLSENTNVEVGAVLASSDANNSDINIIATDCLFDKSLINKIALELSSTHFVFDIIHSHPGDSPPSGFNVDYTNKFSDKNALEKMKQKLPEGNQTLFFVYAPKSRVFYRYDNSNREVFETYSWNGSSFTWLGKKSVKR